MENKFYQVEKALRREKVDNFIDEMVKICKFAKDDLDGTPCTFYLEGIKTTVLNLYLQGIIEHRDYKKVIDLIDAVR